MYIGPMTADIYPIILMLITYILLLLAYRRKAGVDRFWGWIFLRIILQASLPFIFIFVFLFLPLAVSLDTYWKLFLCAIAFMLGLELGWKFRKPFYWF